MSALSRSEWRRLSRERVDDAEALLRAGRWSGAYYLSGLAIECALKAVIARAFKANSWPDRAFVVNIYSHDLEKLVRHAGLRGDLTHQQSLNPAFDRSWRTVLLWGPEARYRSFAESEARGMYRAASARRDEVLAWVRRHW